VAVDGQNLGRYANWGNPIYTFNSFSSGLGAFRLSLADERPELRNGLESADRLGYELFKAICEHVDAQILITLAEMGRAVKVFIKSRVYDPAD
jgi:hypothetical protein